MTQIKNYIPLNLSEFIEWTVDLGIENWFLRFVLYTAYVNFNFTYIFKIAVIYFVQQVQRRFDKNKTIFVGKTLEKQWFNLNAVFYKCKFFADLDFHRDWDCELFINYDEGYRILYPTCKDFLGFDDKGKMKSPSLYNTTIISEEEEAKYGETLSDLDFSKTSIYSKDADFFETL